MIIYCGEYDITTNVGNISRSDTIDGLAEDFSFNYVSSIPLELGERISVYDNGQLLYYGMIVTSDRNGNNEYSYSCYDDAYLLNKNQAFIQFNNISVKDAITKLCNQQEIPLDLRCELPTMIDKIYDGVVISDILKELLKVVTDETNEKFRFEYNGGKLLIDKYSNLIVYPTYTNGTQQLDATKIIGSLSRKDSIENLCNKVIIISGSEKNAHEECSKEDTTSIDLYGQFTHYEKIDDKDISQARNIADKKLKELNKITTDLSVTLLGDNNVRSGRCIYIEGELYLIKSCKHEYSANSHTMELELCGLMN